MLSGLRVRARVIAAAILVSLVTLGTTSALPHPVDCHDAACALTLTAHDPSAHGIQPPGPQAEHPLHCVLCHLTRLSRPSSHVVHTFAPSIEGDSRVPVQAFGATSTVAAAQPPLRAPPVSPVHVA